MKRLFFYAITLCFFAGANIQSAHADTLSIDTNSFGTPRNTLIYFIKNMKHDAYHPEKAAEVFEQNTVTLAEATDLAVKFKRALTGRGIFIVFENVPNDSNYVDTLSQKSTYLISPSIPGVYLEKKADKWLFPETVVPAIDNFYSEVFPLGSDMLLKVLPKDSGRKYLGLYLWQIFALLILLVGSFLLHKLFSYIINHILFRIVKRMGYSEITRVYLMPLARPLSILIIILLFYIAIPLLQLPIKFSYYMNAGMKAFLPLIISVVLYKLVDVFCMYLQKLAGKTETTLDDQLIPLLRKILKVFVIIIGTMFILQNLNVNITALLAGISIGGLAFALAAQDMLKNFFGSIMIFLDKPFQIGHWISSGDIDGTVEEVGFRSTRVRTFSNSLTYVPNAKLADSTIDNHGLRQYRRFSTTISITYDTPPELIKLFVEGLNRLVTEHPHTRKDFFIIRLNEMASSSLNIMFYIFFDVPDWNEELRCKEEILLNIISLAKNLEIRFAFPTQTLHMETFPEKTPLTPVYEEVPEKQKNKFNLFFSRKN